MSTTEVENIAANELGKEMLWLKMFLQELGFEQEGYTFYCDSQSAIDFSKNSTLMKLEKIHTNKNSSYMMTKVVVSKEKLEQCFELAGLNSQ